MIARGIVVSAIAVRSQYFEQMGKNFPSFFCVKTNTARRLYLGTHLEILQYFA